MFELADRSALLCSCLLAGADRQAACRRPPQGDDFADRIPLPLRRARCCFSGAERCAACGRLVGIYKTHHCTKSVTINPAKLAAHIPSSVPAL